MVDKRVATLLSKYDGKADITSWISSMRSYFEVMRTPQEDRSMIMGTNTEPAVRNHIELQAVARGYERIDLTDWLKVTPVRALEDLLLDRYRDKHVALKARLKLEALKGQTWRSSMQALEQHLTGLFTTPDLGMTDVSCMDVVMGVAPKEYLSLLALKDHATWRELMKDLVDLEAKDLARRKKAPAAGGKPQRKRFGSSNQLALHDHREAEDQSYADDLSLDDDLEPDSDTGCSTSAIECDRNDDEKLNAFRKTASNKGPNRGSDQNTWDKELHKVKGLYNNSIHFATGVTPNQLQYGWPMRNPLSYLFLERSPGLMPGMPGYNAKYARLLKAATAAMNKCQHAMIKHANKLRKEEKFKVGDYVWVKMSEFSDEEGISRKLLPLYYGPWQILKVHEDGTMLVLSCKGNLGKCGRAANSRSFDFGPSHKNSAALADLFYLPYGGSQRYGEHCRERRQWSSPRQSLGGGGFLGGGGARCSAMCRLQPKMQLYPKHSSQMIIGSGWWSPLAWGGRYSHGEVHGASLQSRGWQCRRGAHQGKSDMLLGAGDRGPKRREGLEEEAVTSGGQDGRFYASGSDQTQWRAGEMEKQKGVEEVEQMGVEGSIAQTATEVTNDVIKQLWTIASLSVAFAICNMDKINMSIAVIPMSHQLSWSATTIGLVQSSFFWGYVLSQLPGGWLASRLTGGPVLRAGVFLWSAATAAVPVAAPFLPVLLFSRFLVGLGEGVAPSAATDVIARTIPAANRSRAVSFVFGGLNAGSVVGFLLAPACIERFSWETVFYLFGFFGLIWCVLFENPAPAVDDAKDDDGASTRSTGEELSKVNAPFLLGQQTDELDGVDAGTGRRGQRGGGGEGLESPALSRSLQKGQQIYENSEGNAAGTLETSTEQPSVTDMMMRNGSSGEEGPEPLSVNTVVAGWGQQQIKPMIKHDGGDREEGKGGGVDEQVSEEDGYVILARQNVRNEVTTGEGRRCKESEIPKKGGLHGAPQKTDSEGDEPATEKGMDNTSGNTLLLPFSPSNLRIRTSTSAGSESEPVPWGAFFQSPAVWAMIYAHFCNNWGHYTLLAWLPTYFSDELHLNLSQAALVSLLPPLASIAVSSVAAPFADRLIGRGVDVTVVRKLCQTIGFLSPATCLGITALNPQLDTTAVISLLTGGLGLNTFVLAGLYCTHQDISPRYASILLGVTNTAGSIPGILGVALTGYLLDHTHSWALALFTPAIFCHVTGTIVWNVFASSKPQDFRPPPPPPPPAPPSPPPLAKLQI
ncbi:hypothetical protein CBR_g32555 [Chara braunii]|uniref:Major facilitator superfamily (MFS) profile domain-containing protein n=1 Tax=Chara braunii TaxID=69332 RepID=A0A388LGV9_CHABU|nr:hypothetical protein CBR_g32555 [Chara braunii]|eukprot:GBG81564.1 hypothetical protein CBR_g32555 [Chara braunii]